MAARSAQIIVRQNQLPAIRAAFLPGVARALNVGAMATIGYADPLTPVDTGLLKGNKSLQIAGAGSLTASVTWNQHYAIYQEMGTSRGVKAKKFAATGAQRATPAYIAAMKDALRGAA